jgi:SAM-dependent methyltransferase
MTDGGIDRYYDRLARWNSVARAIGYGGGSDALTVHRALADPRANGRATTSRLHDVLIEHLPALANPDVLDAGCGLGGTMIALARRFGGTYVGLTLSKSQASIATRAVTRLGAMSVRVQSYDDPPAGPFDLIVALESLAHSPNPRASLAALARVLRPGGRLAIADDMPTEGARASSDLAAFKAGWQCPVLWGRTEYLSACNALGLAVVFDIDLTADCRPRPLSRIAWLQALNHWGRAVVPISSFRRILESHQGGLGLERLYRHGLVEYRLLVLRAGADCTIPEGPARPDRSTAVD